MDRAAKLAELKRVLATPARPQADKPDRVLSTGVIDDLLGGGFPRGRVAQLAGARSSGKAALALQAAARATTAARLAAWIDARHELYPPAAAAMGVDLARLLIVRPPPTVLAAARAAEIVAQSRAFALIVVDLTPGVLERTAGARLRQAAHDADAAVVLLTSTTTPVSTIEVAALRVDVTPRHAILQRGGAAPPGTRHLFYKLRPALKGGAR